MALTDQDKSWIAETLAKGTKHLVTKDDLKASEKRIGEKLKGVITKQDLHDQNRFFSKTLRRQTREILNSLASGEVAEQQEEALEQTALT